MGQGLSIAEKRDVVLQMWTCKLFVENLLGFFQSSCPHDQGRVISFTFWADFLVYGQTLLTPIRFSVKIYFWNGIRKRRRSINHNTSVQSTRIKSKQIKK